ncbi:LCP family protein [Amycolatopsis anabasis]|uniref:LCP family protein n=1 Tax=Amycolatopsis anabasis TaxID=1840409 RepID=UPI00131C7BE1|nr:LCP family protein [Amycolatopsis anabasis]
MARRRAVRIFVKSTALVISAAALVAAGWGWATYRQLTTQVASDDVITSIPGSGSSTPGGDVNILLVGMDSRTDPQGHPLPREVLDALQAGEADGHELADTTILMHIPADKTKKAWAVSFPRDSYVDTAGGFGKHKLNSAYARAKAAKANELRAAGVTDPAQLDKESATAGRKNLIATVTQLTGVHIDHYAEVNLYGFSEITKAVGGVPVCLNNAVNDSYSGANFPAGPQTLTGVDALKFVRQRHGLPGGDLDRVRRQQAFMAGLANRVLSAGTLTDPGAVTDLINAVTKSVLIDQGWNLIDFAQQLRGLAGGNVEFHTIPTGRTNLSTSDGSAVEVDPVRVKQFMRDLTDGTPVTGGTGGGGAQIASRGSASSTPAPPPAPPISANGVTCVN